ncbi:MAG: DUF1850 domain-containing protein [Burkholderiaceae bacterium]
MSALCLAAAGLAVTLPLQTFTLAWTHSIEKIRWEEDYKIVGNTLVLTEARIRGSGAGMDPPDGAVFKDGVWHYKPALPPLPRLHLARSPFTVDYTLCWNGTCHPMAELAGPPDNMIPVDAFPCPSS